ncbi:2-nitropropane dioxygenase [Cunninghamella echinulata]|nr:2-nitropropane dioxygenase [Cunninghamella echinulata]
MSISQWTRTRLTKALNIKYPLISGPAAGHINSRLVADVCNSGGLGSLAAAMYTPDLMRSTIRDIQSMTQQPFAVNLFCRMETAVTPQQLQQTYEPDSYLNSIRKKLNIPTPKEYTLRSPPLDDQLQVILEENVKIVSFTFGYLSNEQMEKLRKKNIYLMGTASTVTEALTLAGNSASTRKVDCIIAQGLEAGGHRSTFLPLDPNDPLKTQYSTVDLVKAIKHALKDRDDLAIVCAGGISNGQDVAKYLIPTTKNSNDNDEDTTTVIDGVVMGTLFMLSTGSSTPMPHRQALIDDQQPTRITKALTGRYARGIPNAFMKTLETDALKDRIPCYDIHSSKTKDIASYATEHGIPDYMLLWSGDRHLEAAKYTNNGSLSTKELMEKLVNDVNSIASKV